MGLTDLIDDVLVTAGVLWLVVRQFQWRDAMRMTRIGGVLVGLGAVLLLREALTARWTSLDAAVLGAEIATTGLLGAVMGTRYSLRRAGDVVLARLQGSGVALWAAFLLVRLASLWAAQSLGSHPLLSTGALLVVFGANRMVTGLVVRRRIDGTSPARA